VLAWLTGFVVSTEMLHLSGAGLGFVVGMAMLKLKLVDCENWDLLAVMADRAGESAEQRKQRDETPAERKPGWRSNWNVNGSASANCWRKGRGCPLTSCMWTFPECKTVGNCPSQTCWV
jgi:hypothetical protein